MAEMFGAEVRHNSQHQTGRAVEADTGTSVGTRCHTVAPIDGDRSMAEAGMTGGRYGGIMAWAGFKLTGMTTFLLAGGGADGATFITLIYPVSAAVHTSTGSAATLGQHRPRGLGMHTVH